MSHIARERRNRLLDELIERQQILVSDVAKRLQVSEATIRRDLMSLAEDGHAELVHGGARLPQDVDFSFHAKQLRHGEAKATIGRLAASLVKDNELIFLDSGTTCAALAPHLVNKRGLRVVLNSPRLALEVRGPQLIMLGGQYRPDRMDTVGPLAHTTLAELRGYVAFVGADGIDKELGPSASDIDSAHLYRLVITNARSTVLMVDHSKFAVSSLFRIIDWSPISTIVTDKKPSLDWTDFFAARNIRVIYPE